MTSPVHPTSLPATPDWHADWLRVAGATPAWFDWALAQPFVSQWAEVEGCPIHYLRWADEGTPHTRRGLLFVHGGGAHANWWRFVAPFFARDFAVAALDLSGMGESGNRPEYSASLRAKEIKGVMAAAGFGARPFVVGHSFGGYMAMAYGALFGAESGGIVIADTPVYRPDANGQRPAPSRPASVARYYPDVATGVDRFRLMPTQDCANPWLVEFIARHSLRETPAGWTWKFDIATMNGRRWDEPFHDFLQQTPCRRALIYGADSALVSRDTAEHMAELMGPQAPVVEIPAAHHHLMLDQPIAFISALRAILAGWVGADARA